MIHLRMTSFARIQYCSYLACLRSQKELDSNIYLVMFKPCQKILYKGRSHQQRLIWEIMICYKNKDYCEYRDSNSFLQQLILSGSIYASLLHIYFVTRQNNVLDTMNTAIIYFVCFCKLRQFREMEYNFQHNKMLQLTREGE